MSSSRPTKKQKHQILYLKPNHKLLTFSHEKLQKLKHIIEWAYDHDPDDYERVIIKVMDKTHSKRLMYTVNYKIVVAILLYYNFSSKPIANILQSEEVQPDIEDFKDIYKLFRESEIDIPSLLRVIVQSIIKLITYYDTVFISYKSYLEMTNQLYPELLLYRGFKYTSYLLDYVETAIQKTPNTQIIIPCILSSTVYKHIAKNFTLGEKKVLWQITVPQAMYAIFKYSYIGENEITVNYDAIDETLVYEAEFLLNYGMVLIYNNTTYEDQHTIYHFTFAGYDSKAKETLTKQLPKYIEDIIDNLEISNRT